LLGEATFPPGISIAALPALILFVGVNVRVKQWQADNHDRVRPMLPNEFAKKVYSELLGAV